MLLTHLRKLLKETSVKQVNIFNHNHLIFKHCRKLNIIFLKLFLVYFKTKEFKFDIKQHFVTVLP